MERVFCFDFDFDIDFIGVGIWFVGVFGQYDCTSKNTESI